MARVVRQCHDLPGKALWTWVEDDGTLARLSSTDVNDYLRKHSGLDVTAKTFRIWMGSLHALEHLMHEPAPSSPRRRARQFLAAVDAARAALRNTRAVCRRSYIHPAIEYLYARGQLEAVADHASARATKWLDREEVGIEARAAASVSAERVTKSIPSRSSDVVCARLRGRGRAT